jgi:hypothetical protein
VGISVLESTKLSRLEALCKKGVIDKMKHGTTVRLVRHGERHPYVIEVVTPGWQGCDHAIDGTIKRTMPGDLRDICDVLAKANVKYYSVSDPRKEGVIVFTADGATEFGLGDANDFEAGVAALVYAGWLLPDLSSYPTVQ